MSKAIKDLDLRSRLENLYESLSDANGTSKAIVEKYIGQIDLKSDYFIMRDICFEMKQYDWIPTVDTFINETVSYVRENAVSIGVTNTLENLRKDKNHRSYSGAINTLEELKDLSESDLQKRLPNKMRTHAWVPGIKELVSETEALTGTNDTSDKRFTHKSPVSPVMESETGETLFCVGNRVYSMNESEELRLANREEVSDTFLNLVNLAENFTATENGLRLTTNNKIVDLIITESEGEKTISVELDGAKVNENHLSAALMSSGKFRTDEYDKIRVLEYAVSEFKNLYELDFVDSITSNVYEGVEVHVMKTNNGVYINKINSHMNENTLIKPDSTKHAISVVQEFVDYDITNSVQDLLEAEKTAEESKEQEETDVYERIDHIKNEISKLSSLGMDEMDEIQEAKKLLNDALLKEQDRLNTMFKSKNVTMHEDSSDGDYVPGELKIKVDTYAPGTKVQVSAGQYAERGAKDAVAVILPNNKMQDVQKKYLSVAI